MLRKILSFVAVIALSVSLFSFSSKPMKAKATSSDFDCTYSTVKNPTTNLGYFGAKEVIHYTEEEATAAGVPAGFSGDVLKIVALESETNMGILCDFSHLNIPAFTVESITFRVYVANDANTTDGYPEIRIPKPYYYGEWTMRYYDIKDHIAEWHDVVYTGSLTSLCTDGYLDKFEVALRHKNVCDFYIDSIKINYVDDTTAPVINYTGSNEITLSKGQEFNLNVTAIDAVQGEVDVEYIWGDPSRLDGEGKPLIGEHTLTLRATDYFGNVAERTLTVTVITPDTTAPTIVIPTENIYVKVGTTPLISVEAYDDRDDVTPTYTWSEGALDEKGKLTEGEHVLTITATDLSENKTTKTITFTVTAEGDSEGTIIDEEELCPDEIESTPEESQPESEVESESTPEQESVSEVESESTPEESQPESEVESESTPEQESVSEVESESTPEQESVSEVESEQPSTVESSNPNTPVPAPAPTKKGCKGAITTLPLLSILAFGGFVAFIKKRK